jgi:hypothetical protein
MSRSLPVALALALASAAAAETSPAWRWAGSIGASALVPRLHGLDNALQGEGVNLLDRAFDEAGAGPSARPRNLPKTQWAFGGQLTLSREFDEDLRGGLLLGFAAVHQSGEIPSVTDTTPPSGTWYLGSSTSYAMSERLSLPLAVIGIFFHRVFRYESEPDFRLYLGGWGQYGLLLGGSLRGQVTNLATGVQSDFRYDLAGSGFGMGALGGAEFDLAPRIALYLESGFDYLVIPKVEASGVAGSSTVGSGELTSGTGKRVGLDFSGFFLRLGVRGAFGGAPD